MKRLTLKNTEVGGVGSKIDSKSATAHEDALIMLRMT